MALKTVFMLILCIYLTPQLPLVLDAESEGIDIRLWVQVISATSDKLREVSDGSHSPTPFKSSLLCYFQHSGNSCFLLPEFLRKHRQWGDAI